MQNPVDLALRIQKLVIIFQAAQFVNKVLADLGLGAVCRRVVDCAVDGILVSPGLLQDAPRVLVHGFSDIGDGALLLVLVEQILDHVERLRLLLLQSHLPELIDGVAVIIKNCVLHRALELIGVFIEL